MNRSKTQCCYCRREIQLMRNGAWYHKRNASVSCWPGQTSSKATPAAVMP
jgi:hypothetical protein